MKRITVLAILAVVPIGLVATSSRQHDQQKTPDKQSEQSRTGEQVFRENCSRCHAPPMTLAPRITGTVIMHMRVRARLSKDDERLLLQYLAP